MGSEDIDFVEASKAGCFAPVGVSGRGGWPSRSRLDRLRFDGKHQWSGRAGERMLEAGASELGAAVVLCVWAGGSVSGWRTSQRIPTTVLTG